ncbi:MAG TPA: hypothetical protein PKC30_10110 [Saprospiraceae bacterium]|nr:hypothetical protein [Saprospiraceae bacterium]
MNIKNHLLLLFTSLIFWSCSTSSTKLFQRGDYDGAIFKSVNQLKKKPNSAKEAEILDRSFRNANLLDNERVRFLKRENDPRNQDEIVQLYLKLRNRQTLVNTVTPIIVNGRRVQYEYIDYDEEIIAAKSQATEFLYDNAQRLMKNEDKESYRQAYYELKRVEEYAGNYRDVRRLRQEAWDRGVSRALVLIENQSHLKFDRELQNSILSFDPRGLDSEWVEFHMMDLDENLNYDYYIAVEIALISISPDIVDQKDRVESKIIDDGEEVVKDAQGKPLRDSLGNAIVVPKKREITCAVVESFQKKTATMEGFLSIYTHKPRTLLKKEPIVAVGNFEHISARAIGNQNALSEETKKKVQTRPAPFPNDFDMLFITAEVMRPVVARVIRNNRRLII